jgi:hypothetical protein
MNSSKVSMTAARRIRYAGQVGLLTNPFVMAVTATHAVAHHHAEECPMKRLLVIAFIALALPCLAFGQAQTPTKPPTAQAPDPMVGTWELNLAKSTFTSGAPPKSSTRTFEAVPNGYRFVNRGVDAAGKPVLSQWTAYFDGKDYPLTGSPDSDTISIKRIDGFTGESIQKKAGKVVYRNRRVISPDGKVFTLTVEGTDTQGKAFTNVLVFDRR